MSNYNYLKCVQKAVWIKSHEKYLQSGNWNQIRDFVLKRDNYTCIMCGKTNVMLFVHHKTYIRHGHENPSDLITLCYHCHEKVHGRI
jgi:5-methylcytosine-specific restriction endonuclease McrA